MSGSTGEPFNVVVDRWAKTAQANTQAVFNATVSDTVARLKELTPVKTGYLRAGWIVTVENSVSAIPSQQGDAGPLDFGITDLKLGERAIIVNPVVYARRLNYGFVGEDSLGRHYHQAGYHFVEQVVAELPQIITNAVRRVTGQ